MTSGTFNCCFPSHKWGQQITTYFPNFLSLISKSNYLVLLAQCSLLKNGILGVIMIGPIFKWGTCTTPGVLNNFLLLKPLKIILNIPVLNPKLSYNLPSNSATTTPSIQQRIPFMKNSTVYGHGFKSLGIVPSKRATGCSVPTFAK
jgi:hypothetical protein